MKNIKDFLFLFLLSPLLFTACKKDNSDITTIGEEEEIIPDTTICTINTAITLIDTLEPEQLIAMAVNGVAPLNYLWSTGETEQSINPSTAGTYSVTVTDNEGCYDGASFDYAPASPCTDFMVEISATDSTTFLILTAEATGGTQPYSYSWSDGSTTKSIDTATSGTYSVTVEDTEGCTTQDEINL